MQTKKLKQLNKGKCYLCDIKLFVLARNKTSKIEYRNYSKINNHLVCVSCKDILQKEYNIDLDKYNIIISDKDSCKKCKKYFYKLYNRETKILYFNSRCSVDRGDLCRECLPSYENKYNFSYDDNERIVFCKKRCIKCNLKLYSIKKRRDYKENYSVIRTNFIQNYGTYHCKACYEENKTIPKDSNKKDLTKLCKGVYIKVKK